MAIKKVSGRQHSLEAVVTVNFADVAGSSGIALAAIEVPEGGQVIGGEVDSDTAFNSATSDSLQIGDSGSNNRYLGATSIQATGRTALVPTGYKYPTVDNVTVKWTGVGAVPTAGSFRLRVAYIVDGKADLTQGLDNRGPLATTAVPGA